MTSDPGETTAAAPRARDATNSPLTVLRRAHRALAVIAFDVVLLVLVLEGMAALTLRLLHVPPPGDGVIASPLERVALTRLLRQLRPTGARSPVLALDDATLSRIYPGWRRDDLRTLLTESYGRQLRFDGTTQFREAPFRGRYVHVDAAGFRDNGGGAPWPPPARAYVLWVLGGSTAFGYGLPDAETIPAQLERILRRRHPGVDLRVYNFGQGYFYGVQELALFDDLLRDVARAGGVPPRRVVFLDGINEHFAAPFYTDWIGGLLTAPLRGWLRTPVAPSLDGPASAERWLVDQRLARGTSAAIGARALFVWQPTPDWGYDLRLHPLWTPRASGPRRVVGNNARYDAMDAIRRREPARLGDDFLWLADLQRDARGPLYVDRLHYTAAFSASIAERIATALEAQR